MLFMILTIACDGPGGDDSASISFGNEFSGVIIEEDDRAIPNDQTSVEVFNFTSENFVYVLLCPSLGSGTRSCEDLIRDSVLTPDDSIWSEAIDPGTYQVVVIADDNSCAFSDWSELDAGTSYILKLTTLNGETNWDNSSCDIP